MRWAGRGPEGLRFHGLEDRVEEGWKDGGKEGEGGGLEVTVIPPLVAYESKGGTGRKEKDWSFVL